MAAVQAQSREDVDSGSDHAPGHDDLGRLEIFRYLTQHASLDRALESPHITGRPSSEMYSRDLIFPVGIAISGTIGMGLFIRTGEVISLAGSLGTTIAFLVGGFMVTCIMLCMSE